MCTGGDCTESSRHRRCPWGGHPPPHSPPTPCNACGEGLRGGDGSAARGEWLEWEAGAPLAALPCATSGRGALAWGQSVSAAALGASKGHGRTRGLRERGGAAWRQDLWGLEPSGEVSRDQRGKAHRRPVEGMPWAGSTRSVLGCSALLQAPDLQPQGSAQEIWEKCSLACGLRRSEIPCGVCSQGKGEGGRCIRTFLFSVAKRKTSWFPPFLPHVRDPARSHPVRKAGWWLSHSVIAWGTGDAARPLARTQQDEQCPSPDLCPKRRAMGRAWLWGRVLTQTRPAQRALARLEPCSRLRCPVCREAGGGESLLRSWVQCTGVGAEQSQTPTQGWGCSRFPSGAPSLPGTVSCWATMRSHVRCPQKLPLDSGQGTTKVRSD